MKICSWKQLINLKFVIRQPIIKNPSATKSKLNKSILNLNLNCHSWLALKVKLSFTPTHLRQKMKELCIKQKFV